MYMLMIYKGIGFSSCSIFKNQSVKILYEFKLNAITTEVQYSIALGIIYMAI